MPNFIQERLTAATATIHAHNQSLFKEMQKLTNRPYKMNNVMQIFTGLITSYRTDESSSNSID